MCIRVWLIHMHLDQLVMTLRKVMFAREAASMCVY